MTRREELQAAVEAAQAAVVTAERRVAQLRDDVTAHPGDLGAIARFRLAQRALVEARAALDRARSQLAAFDAVPHVLPDDAPVVLLPVRLETRFAADAAGRALLVRIYPDEIHVEAHQPELNQSGAAAGAAYAALLAQAGADADARRRAFVQLAGRVGATRALYVAQLARSGLPGPAAVARPAHSTVLPDRWSVHGFRGGTEVVTATGASVPSDLPLGPAPDSAPPTDGPPLDEGSRWLVDFDAAVAVGMAVRVPMPDDRGLDRLIVLGVRAGEDAAASGERLRRLLEGHRFSAGLDVLPPGTPTNNTAGQRSGWTRRPDAGELFDADRTADATAPDTAAVASALGVPPDVLAGSVHARSSSPSEAAAMHRALWPATLGYVLETFGGTSVDDATVEAARQLFVGAVRGLGPLPLLRVGAQPYGVLPVTSVAWWRSARDGDATTTVVQLLSRLAPEWLAAARGVPHVGRAGADPDQELLDILGREAVSGSYRLRPVRGGRLSGALTPLMADLDPVGNRLADAAFGLGGGAGTPPPLARLAFDPRTVRLRRAPVLAGPLSETDPLPGPGGGPNYLGYLAARSERTAPYAGPGANTLLRALAQHSAQLADIDAAVRLSAPVSVAATKSALEPELVDAVPGRPSATPTRLLARPVQDILPAAPPGQTVGDFLAVATLAQVQALGLPHVVTAFGRAASVRQALGELAPVPSARLDRLTRAALDACSHRLDAWLTGVATQRLTEVRGVHKAGAYLGGYGWVEDLATKAAPQPAAKLPPGEAGPLVVDPANAGYVLAPSLPQASTAALLLSGHLSHRGNGGAAAGAFAVDLSSDRARLAIWLLDGIRQGQPLGALLGYRFERGLHERSHPGLELDRFIRPLRALAPIVAEPGGTHEAVEATAASGVVDGLELLRRWREDGAAVEARLNLPSAPLSPAELAGVRAELVALADAADAVADLLIAETVHQLATGNSARAAAMADAVGSGLGQPPEPEVLRTPRPAHNYLHRLVTLVPLSTDPAPGWAANRPRRLAEPRLDRWAAGLLGPPAQIRAAVRVTEAAGTVSVRELTLADAGVCALDVIHGGDLELLLAESLLKDAATGAQALVLRRGDPDWPGGSWPADVVPLEDVLEQGRWIAESVGTTRPLAAADLDPSGTAADSANAQELRLRANRVVSAFRAAATDLEAAGTDVARTRTALFVLAGYGVRGVAAALCDARLPDADAAHVLAGAARATLAETARVTALLDASPGPRAAEALRAIFGDDFTVLPVLTPPPAWADAVTAGAATGFLNGEPAAPLAWLNRVGRVRAPVERYLLAVAGGGGRYVPVQLPPASRWIGLPLAPGAALPDHALSVLVHAAGAQASAGSVAGLVVDEWTDLVPAASGTAGVAFHFDEPGARAPQAVLVAVPPELGQAWRADTLLDVVRETADLARLRMVGPEDVPWLGRYLPALLVADNAAGATAGIDLRPLVQAEAVGTV